MTEAPTLFDSLTVVEQVLAPTPGRVHRGDPVTARKAAEKVSVRSGTQKAAVLLALVERGSATPHELFATAGCAYPHVATTRLHDLADIGLVEMTAARRPTPTGGESHVWRPTTRGCDTARELREAHRAA